MKTIVGLFDNMEQAKSASLDLERLGISHNDISIVANNEGGKFAPADGNTTGKPQVSGHAIGHDAVVGAEVGGVAGLLIGLTGLAIPGLGWIAGAGWLMGLIMGAGTGAVIGGLIGALTHVGVPHEDASHYAEGVRRGGILVAVKAPDEQATDVAGVLSDNGAVNIDERAAQYKLDGFTPTAATTNQNTNTTDQAVIPVVEEELSVGKRAVQNGGVRVYSHVTEQPVDETVTLREEHVNVQRNPVNRPVTAEENAALRDQTIEMTETSEEAVVAKQARVVEEVVVGKEIENRTETIHDTVRRTDVEVDEMDEDDVPSRSTNRTV